jgi:hypothetical protein
MSETPITQFTPEEHACADALREMLQRFELGEDELSDSRFQDPRHGDTYNALSTMAKFEAMHLYKQHMVAWFRSTCPTSSSGAPGAWANMVEQADEARDGVYDDAYNSVPLYGEKVPVCDEEVEAVMRLCTPERAAAVWLEDFVLSDFEDGLCGYALDVVKYGWECLGPNGSTSQRQFLSSMTGICHM